MRRLVNGVRDQLIDRLQCTLDHLESLRLRKQMADFNARLGRFDRPEVGALRKAIQKRSPTDYSHAYAACLASLERRKAALLREHLLSRLVRQTGTGTPIAAKWAERIRQRDGIHGQPASLGDIAAAWEWKQLSDELAKRSEADVEQLGRRIEVFNVNFRVRLRSDHDCAGKQ